MKRGFLKVALVMAAATVGDGVFALPYVFLKSGWALGLAYFALLGAFVAFVHVIYFKTLERVDEKERLLGLTKKYFGARGFWVGFLIIVIGLLLSLVAILILGAKFLELLFPVIPPLAAIIIFWFIFALPLLLADGRVIGLELVGIVCTAAIIVFVFAAAWPGAGFGSAPPVRLTYAFLPFGVILFSLAGWTGVEPAYEIAKREGKSAPVAGVVLGTIFALILYVFFVTGILGSSFIVSPDTLSGLVSWPLWERTVFALLGFVSVWTISMPISREIRNSLDRDLRWNPLVTKFLILFAPLLVLLAGFNNFLLVVGFVGGLFLSLQYVLIILIGRRTLPLSSMKKYFLDATAVIFTLAA